MTTSYACISAALVNHLIKHMAYLILSSKEIFVFLATLIFNPLSHTLIEHIGWRLTFLVYGVAVAMLSIPVALIFKPRKSQKDCNLRSNYQNFGDEAITVTKRAKIAVGAIWLLVGLLQAFAYYTPTYILVSY